MITTQTVVSPEDRELLKRIREFILTRMDWDNAREPHLDAAWERMNDAREAFTVNDFRRLSELSRGD